MNDHSLFNLILKISLATNQTRQMAQRKDEAKRRAIRDAVIADVVENGLGKLSMPRIARRARVSVGTIYIYFPGKDEMIQRIYLEVKTLLHEATMQGQGDADTSAGRLRCMWYAMFHFTLEHPQMFAFHEAVDAETLLRPEDKRVVQEKAQEIRSVIKDAVRDATLKPLPMNALIAVLLGPAVVLSRRMLAEGSRDMAQVDQVFDAIWAGISK